jgi:hypothetical protein
MLITAEYWNGIFRHSFMQIIIYTSTNNKHYFQFDFQVQEPTFSQMVNDCIPRYGYLFTPLHQKRFNKLLQR